MTEMATSLGRDLSIASRILRKDGLPVSLIFFVTSKSNLLCKHCFYWEELNLPKNELSLEEIEKVARSLPNLLTVSLTGGEPYLRPDLPQIVALDSADLRLVRTLVRQGVADVVSLPLQPEELLQVSIAVMEVQAAKDGSRTGLAPMIAVTRSLGGGGATTLVTHLAACLAESGPADRSVCVFDLDIQFGRIADVLGLSPRRNLTDLLEAGVRLDASLLRSVVATHGSGVNVIAAPQDILPLESLDAGQLHRAIQLARKEFDFVILDIPSNLTNWNLSILAEADGIIMLVEQSLASLKQGRRRLDLFKSVGIDSRIVSVVVNRMERKLFGAISLSDVEQALHHSVVCGLRADDQNIALAQDQGLLVNAVRAKSKYGADVAKLAEILQHRHENGGRR